MEEEKNVESSVDMAEEELEFRPWVKWAGVGGAGALSVALFLTVYFIGYSQGENAGFSEATTSGLVQESLNDAAVQNLLSFMQLRSISEEELLKIAADTDSAFGWIIEQEVRYDAEWYLAEALLERGKAEAAAAVLSPLFIKVPHTTEWGYRALKSGNLLVSTPLYETASVYFSHAVDFFAENNQLNLRHEALGQLIAHEACAPQDASKAIEALEKLIAKLQASDEGTRQLRSMAHVYIGLIQQFSGNAAEAEKKFRSALTEAENLRTMRPEGAVSRGTALLELGDADAAEAMLRIAEHNPGNSLSDISSRLLALRQLSLLEQQRGHNVTAIALLYRAQGVAEGRVPMGNTFWPCLYDQRGWVHYIVQNYQTALLDFNAALAVTKAPMLMIQPQEGAARCYLELGQGSEALPLLESCLQLRLQHTPGEKAAIGRVYLLLGQIYDQMGKVEAAESAYGKAVAHLTENTPEELYNRRTALFGHAYTLTELQRWDDAYAAWQTLLPMVQDQHDRREEVRAQMRLVKARVTPAPEPPEPEPQLAPEPEPQSEPAPESQQ